MTALLRSLFAVLLAGLAGIVPAQAATPVNEVQTAWRLLDYVAVDYREAVADGRVINPAEFREMEEFSTSVSDKIAALPSNPTQKALLADAHSLEAAIALKAAAPEIAGQAKRLAGRLLAAYPVPLAPQGAPDLARGSALFAANCASCHGGKGEGPTGEFAKLNPAPIAFADRDRARERSLFGLYQVIGQGLEGTAMQSFAALPEDDRWALAFHAGGLAYPDAARGAQIWREDAAVRALVPDLAALVALTPAELEAKIGPNKAAEVVAFLRSEPGALSPQGGGSLGLARGRLRESFSAYARGDREEAARLALSAYLDGFEPVEAVLATRDGELMGRVEQGMAGYRLAISRGEDDSKLRNQLALTEALLDEAEVALAPEAESGIATFLGAFAILLREGLEALLVVIAMIAFLRKAERTEALPYVHGGWVGALLAGAGTWAIATYAIGISGASRELTEGFGSLLAAAILLSVGIWMHGKSQAEEWRRYIATRMQGALSKGSAWFLFGLSFLVVYREVFETILFYAALWTPENGATILAGAAMAVGLLGLIAWIMLRYSRKLPISEFFRYSAILIAVLTVVLAGKGIGALQEAGLIGVTPLPGAPRLPILGIFPTAEAIGTQLVALAAVLLGFRAAARPRAPAHAAAE